MNRKEGAGRREGREKGLACCFHLQLVTKKGKRANQYSNIKYVYYFPFLYSRMHEGPAVQVLSFRTQVRRCSLGKIHF